MQNANVNEIFAQAAAVDARPEFSDIDSGYSSGEADSMEPEQQVYRLVDGRHDQQRRLRARRAHRRQHDGIWQGAVVDRMRYLIQVDVAEANARAQHMRRELQRQRRVAMRREIQAQQRRIDQLVAEAEQPDAPLHEPMQVEVAAGNELEPLQGMADFVQALIAHTRKIVQHRHAENGAEEIAVPDGEPFVEQMMNAEQLQQNHDALAIANSIIERSEEEWHQQQQGAQQVFVEEVVEDGHY